jgi:hypothetical protein
MLSQKLLVHLGWVLLPLFLTGCSARESARENPIEGSIDRPIEGSLHSSMNIPGDSSMDINMFEKQSQLILEDYFEGSTYAWGIVEDRFGQLRQQFLVTIEAQQLDDTLVLDEQFLYDDGRREQRIWRIERHDNGRYTGTANDVIGTAQGQTRGNTLHWQYQMDLEIGNNRWRVDFDDRMWLQPGGVLINRADIKKWGITLATVSIFFSKHPPVL